jgi:hypothetical protein
MVDRSVWQPNGGRASLPGAVKYAGTREICNESAVLEIGIMQQIGLIRLGRGHDNVIGVPRTLLDVAIKLAVEDDIHKKKLLLLASVFSASIMSSSEWTGETS